MNYDVTARNLEATELGQVGFEHRFRDAALEREFRCWLIDEGLPMTRIGLWVSVFNWFAALGTLYLVGAPYRGWFAIWVLGIQLPLIVGSLVLSYRPRFHPWLPALTGFINAMAGLTCVAGAFWSLDRPEISMAAVVLVSQFAFMIFPLRAVIAFGAVVPFLAAHELSLVRSVMLDDLSQTSLWFYSLAPGLGTISGLLANVISERRSRERFRQGKIIAAQRKTIERERARADVAERAQELAVALTRLTESKPTQLAPGDLIENKFKIVRPLGRGGMGEVHEVEQLSDGKRFAIKVLTGKIDREGLSRFTREAKIAASIDHPNVVDVVEFGVSPAGMYLVMELIAGATLAQAKERYGNVAWALPVLRQIAAALGAMHARGVVHRDLKPANVLLDGATPKVTDFGIATLGELPPGPIDERGDTIVIQGDQGLTQTGMILGTPHYMAPELSMGSRDPKPTLDIWSFGVIAYELLTGSHPFPEPAIVTRLAGRIVPRARPLDVEVDPAIKSLLARCLGIDYASRPTADELRDALT